jgi:hypothetical protein
MENGCGEAVHGVSLPSLFMAVTEDDVVETRLAAETKAGFVVAMVNDRVGKKARHANRSFIYEWGGDSERMRFGENIVDV